MSLYDVNSNENTLDSRDIILRHEELEERREFWALPEAEREAEDDTVVYSEGPLDETEAEELAELERVIHQGESFSDWSYGVTLIRDSYFEDYAREVHEDINGRETASGWPYSYIDWEAAANALLMDYSDIEFEGVTYWCR